MPIGVIVNSLTTLIGGLIGAFLGKRIPENLRDRLPLIFGIASMGMGIANIVKMETLTVVVLSLILGMIAGELLRIEKGIRIFGTTIAKRLPMPKADSEEESQANMQMFITIVVLFCASGTGIYGSLTEGMVGDSSILLTKAILDGFTSMIFAISLGYMVAVVAIPQFIILLALFLSAGFILPHTDEVMRANFSAFGGFVMLANGFNMTKIKTIPTASLIPGFVLVMPLTWLWYLIF